MPIGRLYQPPQIDWALNADLQWETLTQQQRDAFRGVGRKVRLARHYRLFKFTTGGSPAGEMVSPWWSPVEEYDFDPGLRARLHLAQHFGVSPTELTRIVAAVRTHWNPLTHILTATLLTDVFCFWGQAGWQPTSGDQTIAEVRTLARIVETTTGRTAHRLGFTGSAGQFLIPQLRRGEHILLHVPLLVEDVVAGKVHL